MTHKLKPQFEHDCTKCRLIAVSLTHDYYVCKDTEYVVPGVGYVDGRVLVRRHGNEDSQCAMYPERHWENAAAALPWVAWAVDLLQELETTSPAAPVSPAPTCECCGAAMNSDTAKHRPECCA